MGYTADNGPDADAVQNGWRPDVDTGAYPVIGWYRGAEPDAAGQRGPHGPYDPHTPLATRPLPAPPAPPARRVSRLRPDRWILACGCLVAGIAVGAAFATAGGSTMPGRSGAAQTAVTHAAQPACVTPASGR